LNTEFLKIDPENFDDSSLYKASEIIRNGGLVAFPTETVYGLGASGVDDVAVKNIYVAKGRPSLNPLILHFASPEDCEMFAECDKRFFALAEAFMPGPLTVVLPSKNKCAPSVTAGLATVAVRVPIHPVARRLIELAKVPVAAPSANLSGKPSPTNADHVVRDLNGRVDMIIDGGPCSVGLESTIVKLSNNGAVLLRPGGITLEMLHEIVPNVSVAPEVLLPPAPGSRPESPGMLLKHYAPDAPLYLIRSESSHKVNVFLSDAAKNRDNAVVCFAGTVEPSDNVYVIGDQGDYEAYAKRLFDVLRIADRADVKRIYAPMPSEKGIGLALQNRLLRAAAFRIKDI